MNHWTRLAIANKKQAQFDEPYPNASRREARSFDQWIMTFIEEKGIDLGELLVGDVQVGDVIQGAIMAPSHEQAQIKDMIVKIDFMNGDVRDYFRHLAQAPGLKEMVTELHMGRRAQYSSLSMANTKQWLNTIIEHASDALRILDDSSRSDEEKKNDVETRAKIITDNADFIMGKYATRQAQNFELYGQARQQGMTIGNQHTSAIQRDIQDTLVAMKRDGTINNAEEEQMASRGLLDGVSDVIEQLAKSALKLTAESQGQPN